MAKTEKMITRTISVSEITCYCLSIRDKAYKEIKISVPSFESVSDKNKRDFVEKQLAKNPEYAGCGLAAYSITGGTEKRYGISESLFMQYAHELTDSDESENG